MLFLLRYIKKNFYFLSLFIVLAAFTKVFYYSYAIVKRPYEERLMWNYGFECKKYSYEFLNKVIQQHPKSESLTIMNFENMPNVKYLFHQIKFDNSKKNLILLNLKDKNKLKERDINLNNYHLVHNIDICYFFKKND